VDIVYVGSLHSGHYEHTMLALNHGKHVLVEKPAAIDSKQLKAMYNLAAQKGLYLMEGLWTVFFPAFKKVQELIASGIIGDVNFIQTDFSVAFPPVIDRIWKPELAGGAVMDIGVYSIAIITMLMNGGKEAPADIKASGVIEKGIDVVGTAILKYSNNKIAVAVWNGKGDGPCQTLVVGSKGHIRVTGPSHHPLDIIVHRTTENRSHLLNRNTETMLYHFPLPTEKKLNAEFNFSGSIGFTYEATAVTKDILQKKKKFGYLSTAIFTDSHEYFR